MNVCSNREELERFLKLAANVSKSLSRARMDRKGDTITTFRRAV